MQEQRIDNTYSKPEIVPKEFESDKLLNRLMEKLEDSNIRRVLFFKAYDENGKPTQELKRAWRRYNQKARER